MFAKLLMLAQEEVAPPIQPIVEESTFFTLRNLILVLGIFAVLIIYKVFRDRSMK